MISLLVKSQISKIYNKNVLIRCLFRRGPNLKVWGLPRRTFFVDILFLITFGDILLEETLGLDAEAVRNLQGHAEARPVWRNSPKKNIQKIIQNTTTNTQSNHLNLGVNFLCTGISNMYIDGSKILKC